ncbi:MAG TPA: hypothetical protein VFJ10_10620, partial [Acidobacteriaceae bacterium]|nr:hypothetical protein [Acidobacteriaceae bacterium]
KLHFPFSTSHATREKPQRSLDISKIGRPLWSNADWSRSLQNNEAAPLARSAFSNNVSLRGVAKSLIVRHPNDHNTDNHHSD